METTKSERRQEEEEERRSGAASSSGQDLSPCGAAYGYYLCTQNIFQKDAIILNWKSFRLINRNVLKQSPLFSWTTASSSSGGGGGWQAFVDISLLQGVDSVYSGGEFMIHF